jgi:transposase-like protein
VVDLTCQHKNPDPLLVKGPEIMICPVGARQWSMNDRFSDEDLQAMIDLYLSGATRAQVAQRFSISVSSVKRVLRDHGIRKRATATHGRDQAREQR